MVVKIISLQKVILHLGKRSLFWSSKIFAYLSFTTVRGHKIGFNSCECIKLLNIANTHVLDDWGKRIFVYDNKIFFLCFFSVYSFCNATFSTPVTSSNLRNLAPIFLELRLLQATFVKTVRVFFKVSLWWPQGNFKRPQIFHLSM